MATSEHQEQEETFDEDVEAGLEPEEHDGQPLDEEPGPAVDATPEPEIVVEPEETTEGPEDDHRVAQLRKLKHQFGDELSLTHSSLAMEDEGPALIVCPNCNSEEIRGQKFCSQCNARLPQLPVIEQRFNPGSVDGAARKYYEAITGFQNGTLSLDEFVDFLHQGLEKIRAHAENLAELSSDGVIADWLPEAASLLSNATQLWYESVDGMIVKVEECTIEYEEEEALLEELDEEELAERDPLVPLDERVRMIDFTPELESIFRSNDQMLEYLRIVDTSLKSEAQVGGMEF